MKYKFYVKLRNFIQVDSIFSKSITGDISYMQSRPVSLIGLVRIQIKLTQHFNVGNDHQILL
jgi:hypothetical protein